MSRPEEITERGAFLRSVVDSSGEHERAALAPRLIGVGVRDAVHDAPTLIWAAGEAAAETDVLHVAHTYLPLRLQGCAWEPVARERDARHLAGSRVVSQALQSVAAARADLRIAGSTIAGLPEDVLVELSAVVDLLVVGDDSAAPAQAHRIAWRIQDLAACPVVSVPHGWRPSAANRHPVTLVVDELGVRADAVRWAAEAAVRHDVALQVSRSWASLHEGEGPSPDWLAHQQEELDTQLADCRERYPDLPIVARIECENDWLRSLASGSRLLVVDVRSAGSVRATPPAPALLCPTAVVPAPRAQLRAPEAAGM